MLEVCSWLIERPKILRLANKMLDAKTSSLGNVDFSGVPIGSSSGCPSVISGGTDTVPNQHSNEIDEVRIISSYL
jgi:hypothetical protein